MNAILCLPDPGPGILEIIDYFPGKNSVKTYFCPEGLPNDKMLHVFAGNDHGNLMISMPDHGTYLFRQSLDDLNHLKRHFYTFYTVNGSLITEILTTDY